MKDRKAIKRWCNIWSENSASWYTSESLAKRNSTPRCKAVAVEVLVEYEEELGELQKMMIMHDKIKSLNAGVKRGLDIGDEKLALQYLIEISDEVKEVIRRGRDGKQ